MTDKTTLISNIEKSAIQISKIKVKDGASLYEGKIILFYHTDYNSSKKKTKQLKAKDAGVLGSVLVKEGDVVKPGKGLYTYKSGCSHSTVINDLCAECGIDLQKDEKSSTGGGASVPMVHTIPSLKVSHEQAQILGRADETRLMKDRKLVLLVDLDQTLIHTTNDNIPPNIKVIMKDRKLVLLVDLDQTLIHTTNDNIPPNIKVIMKDRKLVLLVDLDQTLIHTTNDNIPPNIKVIMKDRKLVLLVDLDQTLIHTTNDNIPPNIKVIMKDRKLVLLVDLDQTLIHTTNDNIPPNIKVIMKDRKLVLLVDLDQTLIHTTNDNIPPNIKVIMKDRKLVLLVDLDQTLIHTTNDNIPPNIKVIMKDRKLVLLVDLDQTLIHTTNDNIPPNIKWYELHICTFGSRNYAHQIAHFLDAQGKYFSSRILSRDECFDFHSKTANLKALFPCGDNMVCIIDDREDVWNYALNLIHVKPYHFFRHTGDINAPPGLNKSDNDSMEGYTFASWLKTYSLGLADISRTGVSIKKSNAKPSSSSSSNRSLPSEGEMKKRKREDMEEGELSSQHSVKRKEDKENEEQNEIMDTNKEISPLETPPIKHQPPLPTKPNQQTRIQTQEPPAQPRLSL
ncbi:hypothetical protein WDU94_000195 [Cyamophila willieti]